MAGQLVDRAGVGPGVVRTAAAVAVDGGVEPRVQPVVAARADQRLEGGVQQHGGAVRVGEVVGDDPVAAALRGAGDAAGHPARVERPHGVGHVAGLEVGEGAAVGDHVLQRLDVGVVDGRVVDVGQHTVLERQPYLASGVVRGRVPLLVGGQEHWRLVSRRGR
jgi:hypothetical protein